MGRWTHQLTCQPTAGLNPQARTLRAATDQGPESCLLFTHVQIVQKQRVSACYVYNDLAELFLSVGANSIQLGLHFGCLWGLSSTFLVIHLNIFYKSISPRWIGKKNKTEALAETTLSRCVAEKRERLECELRGGWLLMLVTLFTFRMRET